jgi:hypothetical protein
MKHFRISRRALPALALCAALLACGDDGSNPSGPSTGADGSVSLAAPPAGQGIQVVIGPFEVPTGQEVQKNYYQKLPNTEDIYVTKIELTYNIGSHHLNIFKSDDLDVPDRVEDSFSAIAWESWDMIAASQRESLTWTLPPGTAIRLKARQQMNFQTHYVNALTQKTTTGVGKAIINFYTTDKAAVKNLIGAVFANNRKVELPPHSESTFRKVVVPFTQDAKILWMTGHFHGWGKSFVVNRWDGTKAGEEVYRNTTWAEPPVKFYDPPLEVKAGESLVYTTTHVNGTDNIVKFGPRVETDEHANLFIFYTPSADESKSIYDFTGGELVSTAAAKGVALDPMTARLAKRVVGEFFCNELGTDR